MLHPFITQSWCASGEPPWMPRPTTSESSGNSSSELIRIPGRGRFSATARMVARQVRGLVARAT